MSTFYVTTPIYYVNGEPHIGHAYTTIIADVMARHHRQRGDEVFFLTGTDEHGLKVQRAAEEQGITPKELADKNSASFKALFEKLNLTHDRFIRTTDQDHRKVVETIVERMKAADDIYLDTYEGWYASSDEAFYDEDEIEDGRAISTGSPVEWVEESSYFFRLSKYEDRLLKWYEEHPDCVQTDGRRNEVSSFVASGLRDLSISRTTFDWGIPFPEDEEHVLYVWVDALTNYITGVGAFTDEAQFEKFWPCNVHLIGKDILRFHAVYWPAFLMSAELPLPDQVFAHGWWMNEGEKMSKSKGNFIDAFELADTYPLDVLRYYLVREIPLGSDGNFARARVVGRNNSELADNLGNLLNRSTSMSKGFIDSTIPAYEETAEPEDIDLRKKCADARDAVLHAMDRRETHRALEQVMSLSSDINQYIAVTQPWKLNKEEKTERVEQVLYHILEGLRWVAVLGHAFIPDACTVILEDSFGLSVPEAASFDTIEEFGGLAAGADVSRPEVLFEKLELPEETEAGADDTGPDDTVEETLHEDTIVEDDFIEFDDFMAVELKVARILEAEAVEGADKLLKVTVDAGEGENRTVVAGIAKSYAPEDIVGWHVAMVVNLRPRKVFGVSSQGMLLAVETDDGKLELTRYSDSVNPGTRIS